ncbi:hypothetical protein [Halobellus litoreus]|uniref:Uncharacterized protein n=1 Tax=Halobellus litoreus TaxID=755310 RepID=A0ABD6E059_9EURY|nr:hypothetical protein [Halobellus litoreus]
MPSLTRRRALLTAASGIAALAGCSSEADLPMIDRRSDRNRIEDYEARRVRNEDGAVLFAQGAELPTPSDEGRGRYARHGRSVVVAEGGLAELTFGDVQEAEGLRSFVTETDFDSSSVYLLSMPVEACYEIRLRSATVEWDELKRDDLHPHADFCRTHRPADVECSVEETHTVGFAIRLPVAAEQSSGMGRGMSSSCRPSPRGEYFNATVTPAGGGGGE